MAAGQYRLMSVGLQVKIGVADSHYVTLDAVAKQNSAVVPYCIPNEMICAEIGQFLRLPIPPVGIVRESDPKAAPWFASLNFNLTGTTLPPVNPAACVASLPDLSAGLLLFDILITNSDRHAGNLAVDFLASPPQMSVFDHSHALFGYRAGLGQQRLAAMKERLGITGDPRHTQGNRHCLLNAIQTDDHFEKWLERIKAIPDFIVDEICDNMRALGVITIAEAGEAKEFLKYRRRNLAQIISTHRDDFAGIVQWRLI